jgi:hypothetical protein
MAKVSKNARVNRGGGGGKDMVKVIKAVKSQKSGAYTFKERVVHKDNVEKTLGEM